MLEKGTVELYDLLKKLHTLVSYNTYMITGNAVFWQFFSGIQMWKAQKGEKKSYE